MIRPIFSQFTFLEEVYDEAAHCRWYRDQATASY